MLTSLVAAWSGIQRSGSPRMRASNMSGSLKVYHQILSCTTRITTHMQEKTTTRLIQRIRTSNRHQFNIILDKRAANKFRLSVNNRHIVVQERPMHHSRTAQTTRMPQLMTVPVRPLLVPTTSSKELTEMAVLRQVPIQGSQILTKVAKGRPPTQSCPPRTS